MGGRIGGRMGDRDGAARAARARGAAGAVAVGLPGGPSAVAEGQVQYDAETPAGRVFSERLPAQARQARAPTARAQAAARDADQPPAGADGGGRDTRHEVSLSWVDYEHWSHGRIAPERVARAVVETLIDAQWLPLPARFDAATARRWVA